MERIINKHLIIGCGRSGTKFMATLLQAHGLDVAHEEEGRNGTSDWRKVVANDVNDYMNIVHLVRHPLNAISSIQTLNNESWGFIREQMEVDRKANLIVLCMMYWFAWNLNAEKLTDKIIRIEQFTKDPELLFKYFRIKPDLDIYKNISNNINTRKDKYNQLDWIDLHNTHPALCKKIMLLSFKYDYGVYL